MGQFIQRLVSKSYPQFPVQAREDLAVDAFRNALGDEQLQQHIFSRKVTTLTEAITLATEMEAFLDWQAQQRKNKQGVVDVMSVEQPPPPQSVKNKNTSTSLENTVSVVEVPRKQHIAHMVCCYCKKEFSKARNLSRHQRTACPLLHPEKLYPCLYGCNQSFYRPDIRRLHLRHCPLHPGLVG